MKQVPFHKPLTFPLLFLLFFFSFFPPRLIIFELLSSLVFALFYLDIRFKLFTWLTYVWGWSALPIPMPLQFELFYPVQQSLSRFAHEHAYYPKQFTGIISSNDFPFTPDLNLSFHNLARFPPFFL